MSQPTSRNAGFLGLTAPGCGGTKHDISTTKQQQQLQAKTPARTRIGPSMVISRGVFLRLQCRTMKKDVECGSWRERGGVRALLHLCASPSTPRSPMALVCSLARSTASHGSPSLAARNVAIGMMRRRMLSHDGCFALAGSLHRRSSLTSLSKTFNDVSLLRDTRVR